MGAALDSTLPWWLVGPVLGLAIISLLGLANKRFGVVGGVIDLVEGSAEARGLRSRRVLLVFGIGVGGLAYAVAAGAPNAGMRYSWLDDHLSAGAELPILFVAGLAIGVGARTAGGCTSGHGLTGAALLSPASMVSMGTIMAASAIATTALLDGVV